MPISAKAEIVRPSKENSRLPVVSVIIPCYNYGRYLAQCLDSVLHQEDVRVDVIVIDDASPDGSGQIVRKLGAQDTRIRTVCHATNQGHIATYNEGISLVTGDYTLLLSADDLLTPGCLARAVSLMEKYPSVGLAYGSPVEFADGDLPAARTIAKSWIIWQGSDWIAQMCKTGENVIKCPEAILRTGVLREIGGYHAHLPHAADFELWMRAATVSDVGYLVGADQAYYRNHANNMHHSAFSVLDDYSQRLASFDTIFDERSELLKESASMRDTAHRAIARLSLSQATRDAAYRALARNALSHPIGTYLHGSVGDESAADYAEFALKAWPDATQFREWRVLDKILHTHDSTPSLNLSLIMRMVMRKCRTRFLLWRRKWAGV